MSVKIRSLTTIALMGAVVCILGPFVIPLGIIPLNFTGIGIYLAAFLIGGRKGAAVSFLYLLIGLIGFPVFSGFTSGPGKLLGPTGGYLLAYLPASYLTGKLCEIIYPWDKKRKGTSICYFFVFTMGNLLLYICGSLWLSYSTNISMYEAVQLGVFPFLVTDGIKNMITVFLGRRIKRGIEKFF